jgi:hypothetical protein
MRPSSRDRIAILGLAALTVILAAGTTWLNTADLPPGLTDPKSCELKVVDGIIKQCCMTGYSMYYNCSHFAGTFVSLCKEQNLDCKYLSIYCPKDKYNPVEYAHAINTAVIDGKLCLVEPQGNVLSCDVDTPEKMKTAICKSRGYPPDCSCTTEEKAIIPNYDFASCALKTPIDRDRAKPGACKVCCDEYIEYIKAVGADKPNQTTVEQWRLDCYSACNDVRPSYACPGNCRAGFFPSSCNRKTCRQQYNIGRCATNNTGGACKVIDRQCENPARNCDDPSQIVGPIDCMNRNNTACGAQPNTGTAAGCENGQACERQANLCMCHTPNRTPCLKRRHLECDDTPVSGVEAGCSEGTTCERSPVGNGCVCRPVQNASSPSP